MINMNIKELKELLEKFPEDTEIRLLDYDYYSESNSALATIGNIHFTNVRNLIKHMIIIDSVIDNNFYPCTPSEANELLNTLSEDILEKKYLIIANDYSFYGEKDVKL